MPIVRHLEDIQPDSGKEICVNDENGPQWVMLFVQNGELLAYQNSCPHQGRALNIGPDHFILTPQGELVCPHHGATFELESGQCISGPCKGSKLNPVPVTVENGEVSLA